MQREAWEDAFGLWLTWINKVHDIAWRVSNTPAGVFHYIPHFPTNLPINTNLFDAFRASKALRGTGKIHIPRNRK